MIVVHGGGWRSGERGDFPLWNAWFASKGYVVFDIDYRLSPPPTWREAPPTSDAPWGGSASGYRLQQEKRPDALTYLRFTLSESAP